jgi:hypothetical protein
MDDERASKMAEAFANEELAALVAEQTKDARIVQIGKPWMLALDTRVGDDGEQSLLDFVDQGGHFGFGQRYAPDFSDLVCAIVDARREIDSWAEAA